MLQAQQRGTVRVVLLTAISLVQAQLKEEAVLRSPTKQGAKLKQGRRDKTKIKTRHGSDNNLYRR